MADMSFKAIKERPFITFTDIYCIWIKISGPWAYHGQCKDNKMQDQAIVGQCKKLGRHLLLWFIFYGVDERWLKPISNLLLNFTNTLLKMKDHPLHEDEKWRSPSLHHNHGIPSHENVVLIQWDLIAALCDDLECRSFHDYHGFKFLTPMGNGLKQVISKEMLFHLNQEIKIITNTLLRALDIQKTREALSEALSVK